MVRIGRQQDAIEHWSKPDEVHLMPRSAHRPGWPAPVRSCVHERRLSSATAAISFHHQAVQEGATNMTNEPTPDALSDKSSQPTDPTGAEHNKAESRRWIEVFNQRDDAAEADVRGPGFVAYAPASLEPDPLNSEAWTKFLAGFVEGFPDLRLTVEETVGEGELVAQRIHFEGTHTGDFQGLPPTQRRVTFNGLELNRFVDGRVVEHWFQLDALTLLQQLGLVVLPGPRLIPRILAHQLTKLRKRR
jgi:predicted ester cyclase